MFLSEACRSSVCSHVFASCSGQYFVKCGPRLACLTLLDSRLGVFYRLYHVQESPGDPALAKSSKSDYLVGLAVLHFQQTLQLFMSKQKFDYPA